MFKRKYRAFIKVIATILSQAFFLGSLSFASEEALPTNSIVFQTPKVTRHLPPTVAEIDDVYHAKYQQPLVFLIQDAHTNPSGQLNLAKTVDLIIEKENVKTVYVEAGFQDVSLSPLKDYASSGQRSRVAEAYLRKGELSGAEYLSLTSERKFTLWGVEDEKLYWESMALYRVAAKNRERYAGFLDKMQGTVDKLKPKILNAELNLFDSRREAFLKEKISLTDYFSFLFEEVQSHVGGLRHFREASFLERLRQMEKNIDFKAVNAEQTKLLNMLSAEERNRLEDGSTPSHASRITGRDHERSAFYAMLEEKTKIDKAAQNYRELRKYLDYLKMSKSLNARQLFKERRLLEAILEDRLIRTPDERRLCAISTNLKKTRALLSMTLTPDEFHFFEAGAGSLDDISMVGFLNKKIMDLKTGYECALFLEPGFQEALETAKRFYRLTMKRDNVFVDNMLRRMRRTREKKAILIAGGYHNPHLKTLLKSRNIAYLSVTPQVFHETNLARYERLLLNQKNGLPSDSVQRLKGNSDSAKMALLYLINRPKHAVRPAGIERFAADLRVTPPAQTASGSRQKVEIAASRLSYIRQGLSFLLSVFVYQFLLRRYVQTEGTRGFKKLSKKRKIIFAGNFLNGGGSAAYVPLVFSASHISGKSNDLVIPFAILDKMGNLDKDQSFLKFVMFYIHALFLGRTSTLGFTIRFGTPIEATGKNPSEFSRELGTALTGLNGRPIIESFPFIREKERLVRAILRRMNSQRPFLWLKPLFLWKLSYLAIPLMMLACSSSPKNLAQIRPLPEREKRPLLIDEVKKISDLFQALDAFPAKGTDENWAILRAKTGLEIGNILDSAKNEHFPAVFEKLMALLETEERRVLPEAQRSRQKAKIQIIFEGLSSLFDHWDSAAAPLSDAQIASSLRVFLEQLIHIEGHEPKDYESRVQLVRLIRGVIKKPDSQNYGIFVRLMDLLDKVRLNTKEANELKAEIAKTASDMILKFRQDLSVVSELQAIHVLLTSLNALPDDASALRARVEMARCLGRLVVPGAQEPIALWADRIIETVLAQFEKIRGEQWPANLSRSILIDVLQDIGPRAIVRTERLLKTSPDGLVFRPIAGLLRNLVSKDIAQLKNHLADGPSKTLLFKNQGLWLRMMEALSYHGDASVSYEKIAAIYAHPEFEALTSGLVSGKGTQWSLVLSTAQNLKLMGYPDTPANIANMLRVVRKFLRNEFKRNFLSGRTDHVLVVMHEDTNYFKSLDWKRFVERVGVSSEKITLIQGIRNGEGHLPFSMSGDTPSLNAVVKHLILEHMRQPRSGLVSIWAGHGGKNDFWFTDKNSVRMDEWARAETEELIASREDLGRRSHLVDDCYSFDQVIRFYNEAAKLIRAENAKRDKNNQLPTGLPHVIATGNYNRVVYINEARDALSRLMAKDEKLTETIYQLFYRPIERRFFGERPLTFRHFFQIQDDAQLFPSQDPALFYPLSDDEIKEVEGMMGAPMRLLKEGELHFEVPILIIGSRPLKSDEGPIVAARLSSEERDGDRFSLRKIVARMAAMPIAPRKIEHSRTLRYLHVAIFSLLLFLSTQLTLHTIVDLINFDLVRHPAIMKGMDMADYDPMIQDALKILKEKTPDLYEIVLKNGTPILFSTIDSKKPRADRDIGLHGVLPIFGSYILINDSLKDPSYMDRFSRHEMLARTLAHELTHLKTSGGSGNPLKVIYNKHVSAIYKMEEEHAALKAEARLQDPTEITPESTEEFEVNYEKNYRHFPFFLILENLLFLGVYFYSLYRIFFAKQTETKKPEKINPTLAPGGFAPSASRLSTDISIKGPGNRPFFLNLPDPVSKDMKKLLGETSNTKKKVAIIKNLLAAWKPKENSAKTLFDDNHALAMWALRFFSQAFKSSSENERNQIKIHVLKFLESMPDIYKSLEITPSNPQWIEAWKFLLSLLLIAEYKLEREWPENELSQEHRRFFDKAYQLSIHHLRHAYEDGRTDPKALFKSELLSVFDKQKTPELIPYLESLMGSWDQKAQEAKVLVYCLSQGSYEEEGPGLSQRTSRDILKDMKDRERLLRKVWRVQGALLTSLKDDIEEAAWKRPLEYLLALSKDKDLVVFDTSIGISSETTRHEITKGLSFQLSWLERMGEAGFKAWGFNHFSSVIEPIRSRLLSVRKEEPKDLMMRLQDYFRSDTKAPLRSYLFLPDKQESPSLTQALAFLEALWDAKHKANAQVTLFSNGQGAQEGENLKDWLAKIPKGLLLGSRYDGSLSEYSRPTAWIDQESGFAYYDKFVDEVFRPREALQHAAFNVMASVGSGEHDSVAIPIRNHSVLLELFTPGSPLVFHRENFNSSFLIEEKKPEKGHIDALVITAESDDELPPDFSLAGDEGGIGESDERQLVLIRPKGAIAAARLSIQQILAEFNIAVTSQGLNFSGVGRADWVMDKIRPMKKNGEIVLSPSDPSIAEVQLLHPIVESLPFGFEGPLGERFLGVARVGGKRQPVMIRKFRPQDNDDFIRMEIEDAQVIDRLGTDPEFYGVIKNASGRLVVAYATQLVIPHQNQKLLNSAPSGLEGFSARAGSVFDSQANLSKTLISPDMSEHTLDLQVIFQRARGAGLQRNAFIKTREGRLIGAGAADAEISNAELRGRFIRKYRAAGSRLALSRRAKILGVSTILTSAIFGIFSSTFWTAAVIALPFFALSAYMIISGLREIMHKKNRERTIKTKNDFIIEEIDKFLDGLDVDKLYGGDFYALAKLVEEEKQISDEEPKLEKQLRNFLTYIRRAGRFIQQNNTGAAMAQIEEVWAERLFLDQRFDWMRTHSDDPDVNQFIVDIQTTYFAWLNRIIMDWSVALDEQNAIRIQLFLAAKNLQAAAAALQFRRFIGISSVSSVEADAAALAFFLEKIYRDLEKTGPLLSRLNEKLSRQSFFEGIEEAVHRINYILQRLPAAEKSNPAFKYLNEMGYIPLALQNLTFIKKLSGKPIHYEAAASRLATAKPLSLAELSDFMETPMTDKKINQTLDYLLSLMSGDIQTDDTTQFEIFWHRLWSLLHGQEKFVGAEEKPVTFTSQMLDQILAQRRNEMQKKFPSLKAYRHSEWPLIFYALRKILLHPSMLVEGTPKLVHRTDLGGARLADSLLLRRSLAEKRTLRIRPLRSFRVAEEEAGAPHELLAESLSKRNLRVKPARSIDFVPNRSRGDSLIRLTPEEREALELFSLEVARTHELDLEKSFAVTFEGLGTFLFRLKNSVSRGRQILKLETGGRVVIAIRYPKQKLAQLRRKTVGSSPASSATDLLALLKMEKIHDEMSVPVFTREVHRVVGIKIPLTLFKKTRIDKASQFKERLKDLASQSVLYAAEAAKSNVTMTVFLTEKESLKMWQRKIIESLEENVLNQASSVKVSEPVGFKGVVIDTFNPNARRKPSHDGKTIFLSVGGIDEKAESFLSWSRLFLIAQAAAFHYGDRRNPNTGIISFEDVPPDWLCSLYFRHTAKALHDKQILLQILSGQAQRSDYLRCRLLLPIMRGADLAARLKAIGLLYKRAFESSA